MFFPPRIQLLPAFACQRALEHLETLRQSFSLICYLPRKRNCRRRWYRPFPYTWQSADTDKAGGTSSRSLQRRLLRSLLQRSLWEQFLSLPMLRPPAPRCVAHPSSLHRTAQTSPTGTTATMLHPRDHVEPRERLRLPRAHLARYIVVIVDRVEC